MTVITITREYGAGGGEVARRLSEALGWELLDHALLHQAAKLERLSDAEFEQADEQAVSMADRFKLHPQHKHYIHGLTEATRNAVSRGNVILVGRGTRHLVGDTPDALHLRLVAPQAKRAERMAAIEGCALDRAASRCLEVDRTRLKFTKYFYGSSAVQLENYDLVINTGRVPLEDVVSSVLAFIRRDCAAPSGDERKKGRVLTLSRQLGAGESGFAPTLGERLGLQVYDRELLEQEAVSLGVSEADLEQVDESPAGLFQRYRPGSLHQRYFDALQKLMDDLAAQGEVLIVGRGASRVLGEHPRAFHVRLVSDMAVRLRRVMEYRWLAETPARKLIADSDAQRGRFYEDYFGASWSNPLEYAVTVNSGRLGPAAVDLVADIATRFWERAGAEACRG